MSETWQFCATPKDSGWVPPSLPPSQPGWLIWISDVILISRTIYLVAPVGGWCPVRGFLAGKMLRLFRFGGFDRSRWVVRPCIYLLGPYAVSDYPKKSRSE